MLNFDLSGYKPSKKEESKSPSNGLNMDLTGYKSQGLNTDLSGYKSEGDDSLLSSIANIADTYINKPVGSLTRGFLKGAVADIGGGIANLVTSTGLTPDANKAVNNWEANVNNAYEGQGTNFLTGVGRLLGQGTASSLLGGGALGVLGGKAALALGGGKLAQAIGQGAGSFGAWNTSTYDPAGAGAQLENGLSGMLVGSVLGGVGSKAAEYTVNAAQKLKPMMDYVKEHSGAINFPVLSKDYSPSSKFKDMANWVSDHIPLVGTGGIRAAQQEAYKPYAEQVVQQITKDINGTPNISAMNNNQIADLIGNKIQKYSDTLKKDYSSKYISAFKDTENQKIDLTGFKNNLDSYMNGVLEDDGSKGLSTLINHFKTKVPDTVNPSELKNIISSPVNQAFKSSINAPTNNEAFKSLVSIKQNLQELMDDAFNKVSPTKALEYQQAKDAYIFHNNLFGPDTAPQVYKAVSDSNSMNTFIGQMLNDSGKIKKSFPLVGKLDKDTQSQIVASKLQMAINNAYDDGTQTFSLPKLLNGLKSGSENLGELDTTKALEGLAKLYGPTYKAPGGKMAQGLDAVAPYLTGGAAAVGGIMNPVLSAAGLVGASVLGQIAKYSPLQKILIHAGKIGPGTDPSVVKYLLQRANNYLLMSPYQSIQNVKKDEKVNK